MNTFVASLLLFSISFTAATRPEPEYGKKNRPTKLAYYQVGAYVTADRTKLRVNVNKDLGGEVTIQLLDTKGSVYFNQLLNSSETVIRLKLDITGLKDGDYRLKISNGLEMEMRNITITTPAPTIVTRSISIL